MREGTALLELLMLLATDVRTVTLFCLLPIAAVLDYRHYKIPNWLTLGGIAFSMAYAATLYYHGWMWSLQGMLLGFLVTLPLYAVKAMGAGDVKLMAMVGSLVGIPAIGQVLVLTFIGGGIAAVVYALRRRAAARLISNVRKIVGQVHVGALNARQQAARFEPAMSVGKIPYAICIALATFVTVLGSQFGTL
jgi:prepilin peptidase CpaA